jgi:hypothetical protein
MDEKEGENKGIIRRIGRWKNGVVEWCASECVDDGEK